MTARLVRAAQLLTEGFLMFGNTKGWIISAAIVLVMGFILFKTAQLPPVSPPTGKFKLAEPIALPTDPKPLLPPMDKDCNAADLYRQAIAEYEQNEKLYEAGGTYEKDLRAAMAANPKAIQLIVEATNCNRMDLFKSKPQQVVHYESSWPQLTAINQLGRRTVQFGMMHRTEPKNLDEAEKYLNAAFALGYRLYSERVVWEELNHGLNLMFEAAKNLARVAKDRNDEARADQFEQLASDIDTYKQEKIVPLVFVVTSIDSQTIGRYGGDIFGLARQSPEPMWRTEALMSLGRMRYNTSKRGDQIGANREIKKYLNDPDPAVREAAKIANEMTIERYRMLGN